ncbi:hypothetical protein [Actinophytocola glycyrrhizae]|uniref:Uncharacterized protein n=1 Tax=Actinophytocola glycyrrhizae TaxID=2044873 RepID=A0ABV9RRH8_9PSEU
MREQCEAAEEDRRASMVPRMPRPVTISTPVAAGTVMSRSVAPLVTAAAMGWLLPVSTAAARASVSG